MSTFSGTKSLESLIKKPPFLSKVGPNLTHHIAGDRGADSPPVLLQEDTYPHDVRDVHLRATLKTNRTHLKGPIVPWTRSFSFFIDSSESVRLLMGRDGVEQLTQTLGRWCGLHQLSMNTYLSSDFRPNAHSWNEELWNSWLEKQSEWLGGVCLIVSDFHGQLPSGRFWNQLLGRAQPLIVLLKHPQPKYLSTQPLSDCEEDQQNEFICWDKSEYDDTYEIWKDGLNNFIRRSQARTTNVNEQGFEATARACLKLLTTS